MKPTEKPKFVTLTVRVDREVASKFQQLADAKFRPVAAEIRRLIHEQVEKEAA